MRRASKSPSYLIRTPYSYCFRLNVPRDLQRCVGKTEIRYTLSTGYVGLAKSKARLLAGHVQEFFRRLREIIKLGELTDEQIVDMVNRYFRNFINGLEKIRVEPGSFGKGDVFDRLNKLNQSVCKGAKKALTECDYSYVWPNVTNILEKEGLEIEKFSATHNMICRETLKGMIRAGAIEERRSQGDYSDDLKTASPLSSDNKVDDAVFTTPIQQQPFVIRVLAYSSHQQRVVDVVKEFLDVKIQNPVVAPASFARHTNGLDR
jgi:hypothetical protein